MRIPTAGICGFAGATLARTFQSAIEGSRIFGVDNLLRPGAERNRGDLRALGVEVLHGDTRMASDLETVPATDWLIDAAANPSVRAGVDGRSSSRQSIEHNLHGELNLREHCKRHNAGFILLSSSRVYSIPALASLPLRAEGRRFVLDSCQPLAPGATAAGIAETFR